MRSPYIPAVFLLLFGMADHAGVSDVYLWGSIGLLVFSLIVGAVLDQQKPKKVDPPLTARQLVDALRQARYGA